MGTTAPELAKSIPRSSKFALVIFLWIRRHAAPLKKTPPPSHMRYMKDHAGALPPRVEVFGQQSSWTADFTELALETPLSEEQKVYLGMVKSCSEALLEIIDDILDFSKIETGKVELESIPFSLLDCFESALQPVPMRAIKKGWNWIGGYAARAGMGARGPDTATPDFDQPARERRQVHRRRPGHPGY